ncbi:MAG TPA: MbtH family NRPS accessory protein [Thermoanaerobaculia bacterium]|jgi:MbtH protein|nr:MbtH family NRPS accessory protein [Thermoanaerobaculia bacterium]
MDDNTTVYKVIVNQEQQYAIWPGDRDDPVGWKDAGKWGTKEECYAYIEEVWTDMRDMGRPRGSQ